MFGLESPRGFLLRVAKGSELMSEITAFAKQQGIACAALSGIGALSDLDMGYYDAHAKIYNHREFKKEFELLQLSGNVSIKDGEHFVHAHAVISGDDFCCYGGHLFRATVAVTAEIHLVPLADTVARRMDADAGVAILDMPLL